MKNIAIILARSGSKGLPHKNILPLAGKPLIAYSIEAALKSGKYDRVMVSTDSEEYARIAREYGAETPFLRSAENSGDRASSWDAILEVLAEYEKIGETFDTVTLLQPTSPLRTEEDIQKAFALYEEKNAKAVVAFCKTPFARELPEDLSVNLKDRERNKPRQMLPSYYCCNGALYLVNCDFLKEDAYIYREGCYAYLMPEERSYDIDTKLDFVVAEAILKNFDLL